MHAREAFAKASPDDRLEAALATASLNVSVLYLRHRLIAAGATDEQLEAFLTSPGAEAAVGRVQDSPPLLAKAFG